MRLLVVAVIGSIVSFACAGKRLELKELRCADVPGIGGRAAAPWIHSL
jgi:hypothetical protein